jgi:hypothetical protein
MLIDILDDLKANFRSWEQDCDTEEDAMTLISIMMERHPDEDSERVKKICYDWVGYVEFIS